MHPTDLLATLPPELRDYVRELETRATALEMQASALQVRNQFLEEQFRLAQLKRFAPSSEKFGAQGCLFNEAEQDVATLAPDAEEEADKGPKSAGKKRGRKPLPASRARS
ncbi:transposase domain-containing protein [Massilia sp. TWR1-2-2]|uniref:transposase domain-containing protein n=1 Tax=Massilia sp. TWR1-2-2 TaxID=2804584 RepID=UPI003CEBF4A2